MISNKTKEVPIVFATDDNYAPYLSVAIRSLLNNADTNRNYKIYILIDKLSEQNTNRLCGMSCGNATVQTINVKNNLDALGQHLHLRDYYTKATYFRFFIPDIFPQYEKVLYLDCDIVVFGDISKLYDTEIGENYVGAVAEDIMNEVDIFGQYVEKSLGISRYDYFSAGVLLMNLSKFREIQVENRFVELLGLYKFTVTQDQDYLNVICKNHVFLIGQEWNKSPISNLRQGDVQIAHYKINFKPWHYDDILYGNHFWDVAETTEYYDEICCIKKNYTDEQKTNDELAYFELMRMAQREINKPDNYYLSQLRIKREFA